MLQSRKQAILSRIVFGIYVILLAWLILFKFATSLSQLPTIRGINLIPFYYAQETNAHLKEVLYNILAFVPFGVYVHIFREDWKITTKCLTALLTSFFFEVMQFAFAIGASDITDLMGNTLGGMVGILLCILMKRLAPQKCISIINIMGLLIEAAAIGLMMLLLAANR